MPIILALDINSSCHWRKEVWLASLQMGGSESKDLFDLKPGTEPPEVGCGDWNELAQRASSRPALSIASRRSLRR